MLTPRPYQETGRDFLASRKVALLADEMRVGKTPQAILAAHKAGAKSLAVVTRAIAVPQWEREIRRWWESTGAAIAPIYRVMSYEKATELWRSGLRGTVDVFIPDECHFAKNPEAQRTKMVYGKDGFAMKAGATWALSGTPAPKHAGELWPMLRAFGVTGMTYPDFTRRYCSFDWTGKITGTNVYRIPELKRLLAQIMLRRMRRDVAPDMPGIDFQFLNVEYDKSVDLTDSDCLTDDEIGNVDVDREDRQAVALAKVPALVDEIADAVGNGLLKQTVVFGWHVAPLTELTNALCSRGVRARLLIGSTTSLHREDIQLNFLNGVTQVICANILTAGTAIDLSAASHGYFLELDWVPGNNVQAANRLVSMDKAEPVTFDVVTMPGTVDDRVQKVLLRRVKELSTLY